VASKANADVAGAYLESTTTYSYDPVDRLSESVKTGNGAKTETYVHDDNANVIEQSVGSTATTYSYDRNRLLTAKTGAAEASYRYDPFGRQTSVVSVGVTISRTTYDGFDHIAQSEKLNDAGALESTTYRYDPLDRTASKTADGKTTDYTYLGLSSEVLAEEVAGVLTKSYQYSPWGQRLSQITHQADPEAGVEAGESAYYGYNAHTDVETLTDHAGNAVATYGYTAYGNADESEYTGIDQPEAGSPEDAEPYNAYRYNSKRWDAGSGTYDMGFRDYAPSLNRFTTRDMYNGSLADMGLGSDPYSGNRYAFTAGNPISRIERDGHIYDECGGTAYDCTYEGNGGWSVEKSELYKDIIEYAENPDPLVESFSNTYAQNEASLASAEQAEDQWLEERLSNWRTNISHQISYSWCSKDSDCFDVAIGRNGTGSGEDEYNYLYFGSGIGTDGGQAIAFERAWGVSPGVTQGLQAEASYGLGLTGSATYGDPLKGTSLQEANFSGGTAGFQVGTPGAGGQVQVGATIRLDDLVKLAGAVSQGRWYTPQGFDSYGALELIGMF
jgi:RHS repeat-associated protein